MSLSPETPLETIPEGWTLGLDIGSNSVGWMLVREAYVPGGVNAIGGSRVFPSGTANEKGTEASKSTGRRTARGMRRQHHRKSGRKRRLHRVLRDLGLLPENSADVLSLDPYELRARGLDEPLTPHEFGRALLHLAARRGFQSNRRTDDTKDTGAVKEGIAELRQKMEETDSRTVGEYLARLDPAEERLRCRYTNRGQIREEFELLWNAQKHHHPELLTPEAHELIAETIFFQRPFADPEKLEKLVGLCEFEKEEKRCRIGHRLAQRFRILQEVANLAVTEPLKSERPLTFDERQIIAGALDHQKTMSLTALLKMLKLPPETKFNIARAERDKLNGNCAEADLRKVFGDAWDTFDEERRNTICEAVLEMADDDLKAAASNGFGLDPEGVAALMKVLLPERHGRVSLKAIRALLPHLEAGLTLTEARVACGYTFEQGTGESLDLLPAPPTDITNPVVRKALFEVRRVVNAVIRAYGKPNRVAVELARDAHGSIEQRNEQTKQNSKNKKRNETIREELKKMGIGEPSRNDLIKYRLWTECSKICPYTGRPITFADLFGSARVQVEHIVPYPRSLDDSFGNKTLCFSDYNTLKGMKTPYEAFGHMAEWPDMVARSSRFHADDRAYFRACYNKGKRFQQHTFDEEGCVARQLNDTRYISRQVLEYVRRLGVKTSVGRGNMTSELRHWWGLNSILSPTGADEKFRGDHRHHAIDAAVVALTTPRHLRTLARREKLKLEREEFPAPWPGFRDEIERAINGINVSHRPTRRVRGPLHEETNYGLTTNEDTYVYRKPVESLTFQMVADIRDTAIQRLVRERLQEHGLDPNKLKGTIPKEVFEQPLTLPNRNGPPIPIKRVRITTRQTGMVPLPDENGKAYRYAKTGSNHHITLWEWEEPSRGGKPGKVKREAIAVTLFEAAKRITDKQPIISRIHPTKPHAKFLMSLCKNDMVLLKVGEERERLYRVQTFSVGSLPDVRFRLHTASGLDDTSTLERSSLSPDKYKIRKVTVSPIGEIQLCND